MDDFGIFDRCLTRGMPGSMLPGAYNMGIEIHQAPGLVAIRLEMIHETRLVYLDGRTPPPAPVQFDLGYSVGHWDGATLVIDTTNFRPGMSAGPAPNSDQLHIVEHLTPMGPDQIRYEAWIEDPVVMETGYKLDFPWRRNSKYEIYDVCLPRRQRADPRLYHRHQPALRRPAHGGLAGAGAGARIRGARTVRTFRAVRTPIREDIIPSARRSAAPRATPAMPDRGSA